MTEDLKDFFLEEYEEDWMEFHIAPCRELERRFLTLKDIHVRDELEIHRAIATLEKLRVAFTRHSHGYDLLHEPPFLWDDFQAVLEIYQRNLKRLKSVKGQNFRAAKGSLKVCIRLAGILCLMVRDCFTGLCNFALSPECMTVITAEDVD